MTLKADPVFIEVPVPIGTLVLSKHLAGQHDQSTHGRGKGGVHTAEARRSLWATDKTASELKAQVAKDITNQMLRNGISIDTIAAYALDPTNRGPSGKEQFTIEQMQQERWEGKLPASQIIAYRIDRESPFGTVVRSVKPLDALGDEGEFTFEEAQKYITERNALDPSGITYGEQFALYADCKDLLAEDSVSFLVNSWAMSSNNESPESLALQETAKNIFKLNDTADWNSKTETTAATSELVQKNKTIYEGFVQAQYDNTQAMLKSKGISELTVYRGMKIDPSDLNIKFKNTDIVNDFKLQSRPLSSWTTRLEIADRFATSFDTDSGTLFRQVIPASRVIATPLTGVGSLKEQEIVILGGIDNTSVTEAGGSTLNNPFYEDYDIESDD